MLGDRYLSLLSRVTQENALLKLAVVALTVISFLQYRESSECQKQANTILLPPGATETMEVSTTKADEAYLRQISRYVASLAFNYTPSTARGQFSELLALYSPDAYPAARANLEKMASTIESTNLVQTYHLQSKITVSGDVIHLQGLLMQTINQESQPPQTVEYRIKFAIDAGRFRILELWKYEASK